MRHKILLLAAILHLSIVPVGFAIGGGGGGNDRGSPHGQGRPRGGERQGQGAGSRQSGNPDRGRQEGTRDQSRQKTHATDGQRDQVRTCTCSADRIREMSRTMAREAKDSGFSAERAQGQRDLIQNEIRSMQQEHDRFMKSLSEGQRGAMQERIHKMDQSRDRVSSAWRGLDQELKGAQPDPKRTATRAKEMDRATKEWAKHLRKMGSDMGIRG